MEQLLDISISFFYGCCATGETPNMCISFQIANCMLPFKLYKYFELLKCFKVVIVPQLFIAIYVSVINQLYDFEIDKV